MGTVSESKHIKHIFIKLVSHAHGYHQNEFPFSAGFLLDTFKVQQIYIYASNVDIFPAVIWNSAYRVWKTGSFICMFDWTFRIKCVCVCVCVYKWRRVMWGHVSVMQTMHSPLRKPIQTPIQTANVNTKPMQINAKSNQPHNTGARLPLNMTICKDLMHANTFSCLKVCLFWKKSLMLTKVTVIWLKIQ